MANNNKVKGLLKGLRYISQMFENEKEEEMQIGNPTDVKHVAHIGWDGPSVNSPSWMNEFKPSTGTGYATSPVEVNGDVHDNTERALKLASEDSRGRSSRSMNSPERDLPDLPKSNRRRSSGDVTGSPTREKSEKPKQRRSSRLKDSSDGSKPARHFTPLDSAEGSESPARNLPDIPKKSRRKKSKDASSGGSSSKSRLKSQNSDLDPGSPSGSTKSRNKDRSIDEDAESEKG